MRTHVVTPATPAASIGLLVLLAVGSAPAADAVSLYKDLTSVIMLLGLPCGPVVSARLQGDSDYLVSCEGGQIYRVFVNAEGRVVAEPP